MCAYPLPLSASAFSSSPPRFLQVMRGEETNERKEGREREMCALLVPQKGKGRGGALTSAFPYYYFFRYAGNLSLLPLPPLFPPPRLLHCFPCMDSFSSFLRCCLLLCSVGAPFSFYGPRRRRRQKRGSPPPLFFILFFCSAPLRCRPLFLFLSLSPIFYTAYYH